MTVAAGEVVAAKYRVERLLGRGGMGYVVAARHLALDQRVAIKFLPKTAVKDEGAINRFRQEAKASARLKGEHVACVIDVGVHSDEPYIVMEYLEGADLGQRTSGGRALPITEACDYVIQACEALAEAHALGIIHRDIKLPNLFVTHTPAGDPLLKVLDFGVAKTLAPELDGARGDITHTASCIGSPKYMSPEQMTDARVVDERTDIWALGVSLYRLIGGRAPFDADTIGRLCTMVLHELPPSLSALRPELPAQLELVIASCLQKDRDYRFANVAELAAGLAPFASEPERAAKVIEHISNMLGVVPPVPGYLPPAPAVDERAAAFDRPIAWAHTTPSRVAFRRPAELRLLTAGFALLALVVAVMVVVKPMQSLSRTALAAPRPASLVSEPSVITVSAEPIPASGPPPTAVAPTPTGTGPVAVVNVGPPAATPVATAPAPTSHRRIKGRSNAKPPKTREEDANRDGDPSTIPSDRK